MVAWSAGHTHLQARGLLSALSSGTAATASATASTTTSATTASGRRGTGSAGGTRGRRAALSVLLHVAVLAVLTHQYPAAAQVGAVLGVDGVQSLHGKKGGTFVAESAPAAHAAWLKQRSAAIACCFCHVLRA